MVQLLPAGAVTDGVQQAGANCPRPPGPATTGRGTPSRPRPAVSLLADRIAAALMLHDPGWRLPRPTALARHYHVTPAEVEMAMDELVSRRLVRRLPGDQLYRSSPAEYLIPLEGMASLGARVDPMGGKVTCVGSHASDGTSQARPCAITSAALRTDTFRIALESPQPPSRTMEATFPPVWSLMVMDEGP